MDGARLEIFGRLGADPEPRYTPNGKLVTSVSVAVSTGYGDNKNTEWYKCTFWEKSAELLDNLAKKGTFIWVSGSPKIEVWEKDDKTNAKIAMNAREFRILSGGRSRNEQEDDGDNPYGDE